jgi:hypothetical protein
VITRKSKIIFFVIALLVVCGTIGVGAYHVFATATNQAGVGYGALGMDSSFNVSVGSSSPGGAARFVVNASSGASAATMKVLSSAGASLFSVDNSGNVVTAGSLTAGSFVGSLSGTVTAGNLSSGAFGANTGGGNYSFPGNVGIGTTAPLASLDLGAVNGVRQLIYGAGGTSGYQMGFGVDLISGMNSLDLFMGRGNGSNTAFNIDYPTSATFPYTGYTSALTVLNTGNVGIGTTTPSQKLEVAGNVSSTGLCLSGVCNTTWPTSGVSSIFGRSGAVVAASGDYSVAQVTGAAPLASPTFTGSVTMPGGIWNSSGNVGIGTTAPGQKLEVNGNASIDGDLYVSSPGGSWLSGKTGTNGITAASAQTASSYTPILRQTTASGNVVALGGLGDSFGFTTYNSARTTNGVDYYPLWFSTSNGNVGIEQSSPAYTLDVAGQIRSSSGGYVFPDGTTQTTAATGQSVVNAGNVSAGTFGSNTGGGTYTFSGNITAGYSNGGYNISAGMIGVQTSLYSYGMICAGNNSGSCNSANGVVLAGSGSNTYGNVYISGSGNTYFNGGNVGIGIAAPNGKFDVYADNIASATAGDITLEHPTSGGASSIIFPSRSNYGSDYGFITYYDEDTTYAYWGTSTENSALVIGSQNDSMNSVSDVVALQGFAADVIGTAAYPSTMIVNASNNVGIGTTAPAQRLEVNGNIQSDGDLYLGTRGTWLSSWLDQSVTSGSGPTFNTVYTSNWFRSTGATGWYNQTYAGGWFMQDSSWVRTYNGVGIYSSGGEIYSGSGTIQTDGHLQVGGTANISGKLTVPTIDPLYTINGKNYATYVPSMTGQNEETAGTIELSKGTDGKYGYLIDFSQLPTGSDLWLFAKATNLKNTMDRLIANLTPSFDGNVWYEKIPAKHQLIIHGKASDNSSDAVEVSYRLTAPRFDAAKWTTIAPADEAKTKGLIIND